MSLRVLTQGGGTGGYSASIFVTGLRETDTVTAVKDGKTVQGKWNSTKNRFEIAKIKEYGMWSVTATNGEDTTTQDVLVDAAVEFEIEMSYILYLVKNGVIQDEILYSVHHNDYNTNCSGAVSYNPLKLSRTGPSYTFVSFKADLAKRKKAFVTLSALTTNNNEGRSRLNIYVSNEAAEVGTKILEQYIYSSTSLDTVVTADLEDINKTEYIWVMAQSTAVGTNFNFTIKDFWLE
jgi:hypothetical protein